MFEQLKTKPIYFILSEEPIRNDYKKIDNSGKSKHTDVTTKQLIPSFTFLKYKINIYII